MKLQTMQLLLGLAMAASFSLPSSGQSAEESPQLGELRQRYAELLCTKEGMEKQEAIIAQLPIEEQNGDICVMEIYQRLYPVTEGYIQKLITDADSTGSWPDIDYNAKNMSGWPPAIHQMRLLEMVKYHRAMEEGATSPFSKKELEDAIHHAITAWYDKKLVSSNWWQNTIGTPKVLGAAFLLFREHMSSDELAKCQEIMDKQYKLWFTPTGQNYVWLCEAKMLAALLRGDAETIEAMRDELLKEIGLGGAEGIQKDWSFHQHGAQQQMGNYGISYLMSMSFFSKLFAGTELAFSEEQQDILNNLYLQGFQWMRWGQLLDMNAMGRQISRNVMKQKGSSTYVAGLMLQENSTAEQQAAIAKSLPAKHLLGQKHFAESDLTIHRSKDWMASLRMASNRLIGAEICNGDGRTASFMGDGGLYIYKSPDGYEYENILPLWNPRLIPGISCVASDQSAKDLVARNKTNFVGGVTDGQSGITSMELNRYGLHAFKTWVITDEWILCLGSDLKSDEKGLITTSIANRISRDPLYHWQDGSWVTVADETQSSWSGNTRFYHDGIGYIINKAACLQASNKEQQGDWHEVSDFYPQGSMHQDKLLTIYLEHQGGEQDYEYFILPSTTKDGTAGFDSSPIKILYNNADIHAVQAGDSCYLSIRKLGDYSLPFDGSVRIEKPGIYLVQKVAGAWELKRAEYP